MLSDEVLLQLFEFLDVPTKLIASETCKRFDRILESRCSLKNVCRTIDFDQEPIIVPRRNYENVVIKNLISPETEERIRDITELFQMKGDFIRSVKFFKCTASEDWIGQILTLLPRLQSLTFESTKILHEKDYEAPALAQLEYFTIEHDHVYVALRLIHRAKKLKSFIMSKQSPESLFNEYLDEIFEVAQNRDDTSTEHLHLFLSRQKDLKQLHVSHGEFFNVPFAENDFRLNAIVLFIKDLNFNQSKNLLTFVKEQDQIEDLVLNVSTDICGKENPTRNFQETFLIILNLKKLSTLSIIFYKPMMSFFRDCRVVNTCVKDVHMSLRPFRCSHKRFIQAIARTFPEVTKLALKLDLPWLLPENTSPDTFGALTSLKDLKALTLVNVDTRIITSLQPPKLTHITFVNIINAEDSDLVLFFNHNPKIAKVKATFEGEAVMIHSAIRLIELTVLNARNVESIKVCHCSMPSWALEMLKQFVNLNRTKILKLIRVCKTNLLE